MVPSGGLSGIAQDSPDGHSSSASHVVAGVPEHAPCALVHLPGTHVQSGAHPGNPFILPDEAEGPGTIPGWALQTDSQETLHEAQLSSPWHPRSGSHLQGAAHV